MNVASQQLDAHRIAAIQAPMIYRFSLDMMRQIYSSEVETLAKEIVTEVKNGTKLTEVEGKLATLTGYLKAETVKTYWNALRYGVTEYLEKEPDSFAKIIKDNEYEEFKQVLQKVLDSTPAGFPAVTQAFNETEYQLMVALVMSGMHDEDYLEPVRLLFREDVAQDTTVDLIESYNNSETMLVDAEDIEGVTEINNAIRANQIDKLTSLITPEIKILRTGDYFGVSPILVAAGKAKPATLEKVIALADATKTVSKKHWEWLAGWCEDECRSDNIQTIADAMKKTEANKEVIDKLLKNKK